MFRYSHLSAACRLLWFGILLALSAPVCAQLRIVTWNVTNYGGGAQSDIQNVVYGTFSGRSLSPDVILCQEFISQTAVNDFRNALNAAPGSPGDWASATFVNGSDTDSACFFRSNKVRLLASVVVSVGSGASNNQPRNIMRYDLELKGYVNDAPKIACYSLHMKAGTETNDYSRRLIEAQKVRNNAETLPVEWGFVVAGDFNIQESTEAAYVEMVGSQSNNRGRCFDPISTPGSWNNTYAYRFVHSQDPSTQMDDRYDQLLISSNLIDGTGLDYTGNPAIPFSTSTWNDPNHSYRTWGNDGGSYNNPIRTTNNTMVGPTIATSLRALADGQGHLPVYLDLRVPTSLSIVSGTVNLQGCVQPVQSVTFTFRPVAGGPNIIRTTTLSETGTFRFTDIPSANYTVAIKGAKWLQRVISVQAASANVTGATATLPAGDANDNNFCDVDDLALLIAAFDATPADSNWNAGPDFDCDGLVSVDDLALLIQNFDLQGDD